MEKGSGKNATEKVGKITKAQAQEIAKKKMKDLNAKDMEGAIKYYRRFCSKYGYRSGGLTGNCAKNIDMSNIKQYFSKKTSSLLLFCGFGIYRFTDSSSSIRRIKSEVYGV